MTDLKSVAGVVDITKPRKAKEPPLGTKEWVKYQIAEAKRVDGVIDTAYVQLGKIVWDLYDVPEDGNPAGKPAYKLLGHDKFDDFLSEELDLHVRKAQSLRRIYYRLHIELKDLDPTLRERIIKLGWTKVSQLVKVLTIANASSWADYAEKSTSVAIEKRVTQQIDLAREKKAEEEGLGFTAAAAGAVFEGEDAPVPAKKGAKSKNVSVPDATAESAPPEAVAGEAGDLLPSSDQVIKNADDFDSEPVFDPSVANINPRTKMFFFLLPDEKKVVEDALELSRELGGRNSVNENMAAIALDFLATNSTKARSSVTTDYRVRMLAAIETLLGVNIIATDPKNNQPFYASAALKKAAGT